MVSTEPNIHVYVYQSLYLNQKMIEGFVVYLPGPGKTKYSTCRSTIQCEL